MFLVSLTTELIVTHRSVTLRDCCQFESPRISECALYLASKHFIRTCRNSFKDWSRENALKISSKNCIRYPSLPDADCTESVLVRECVRGSFDNSFYALLSALTAASSYRLRCTTIWSCMASSRLGDHTSPRNRSRFLRRQRDVDYSPSKTELVRTCRFLLP